MAAWQQRINDCYGIPETGGFPAVSPMRDRYTVLNDDDLLQLQRKYGFEYAVLYKKTQTRFPTIFETRTYQIVRLTE